MLAGRSAGVKIVGPAKEKTISVTCDICCTEKRFLLGEKKAAAKRKADK